MASHSLNKLTALEVKKAKANPTRTTMLPDGGNLYLRIEPNGNKHWIYNYTRPITSKRNQLSLGSYPNVSLEDARRARDDCKILVKKGIDPAAQRLQEKHQRKNEMDHTFEVVTQKWLKNREIEGKEDSETIRRLNHDALPYIGKLSFDQLTLEVIEDRIFQPILERHAYSVAKRLKSDLNQIFKFARKRKLITYNPIEDIDLPTPPKKNHAAITEPHELASLVKAVWRYGEIYKRSIISTQIAIKLSLLIFQRPGEIRQLKKSNYYKEERCLKLIASKTKQEHIVPLSRQAIALIESVLDIYPDNEYIFVGREGRGCISDNTMNKALERLGFAGKHTAHGSRATARTLLDEALDQRVEYIEHQLAHRVKDHNGTAYNRTKFLEQRRKMMQTWADYLESFLRES